MTWKKKLESLDKAQTLFQSRADILSLEDHRHINVQHRAFLCPLQHQAYYLPRLIFLDLQLNAHQDLNLKIKSGEQRAHK